MSDIHLKSLAWFLSGLAGHSRMKSTASVKKLIMYVEYAVSVIPLDTVRY
jgi:hypothetical protein